MSMEKYIVDTDVIIDLLKGNELAKNLFLELSYNEIYVSVITVAELLAGARNDKEIEIIKKLIAAFQVVDIDIETAIKAGLIKKEFNKSHNIGLADSFIAACTMNINGQLITQNIKHYPMFPNLKKPYKK